LAAVKGNQPKLYQAVQKQFIAQETCSKVNKGHGRIEKRLVSIMKSQLNLPGWLSVKTIIKIESQRQTRYKSESETRYYISDLIESASSFYQRIRGYWGVENKVHYVRDVTFGEDKSRIRILPLPQILAIARNLAINLYRNAGFDNMAQARRRCQFDLDHLLSLFRMK
jgi:predicted transposase YbfD/YdcC